MLCILLDFVVAAQNNYSDYDIMLQRALNSAGNSSSFTEAEPAKLLSTARKNYLQKLYQQDGVLTDLSPVLPYKMNYALASVYHMLDTNQRRELLTYSEQGNVNSIKDFSNWLDSLNPLAARHFSLFLMESGALDIKHVKQSENKLIFKFNGDRNWPFLIQNADTSFLTYLSSRSLTNGTTQHSLDSFSSSQNLLLNHPALIPERNLLNNQESIPISFEYNRFKETPYSDEYIYIGWRPDMWYNQFDGIKIGGRLKTGHHLDWHKVDAGVFYSTGIGQANFESGQQDFQTFSWFFNYSTRLDDWFKNTTWNYTAQQLDGLDKYSTGLSLKSNSGKTFLGWRLNYMNRQNQNFSNYLFDTREWGVEEWNGFVELTVDHKYRHATGFGNWIIALRGNAPGSDYNYGFLSFESKNRQLIFDIPLNIRAYGQLGWGDNFAPESMLYLAGANPEERTQNPISRSAGFIPQEWGAYSSSINHFHESGGLNIRGFSGYFAPYEESGGYQVLTYRGTSGASISGELPWTELLNIHVSSIEKVAKFSSYLFGDVGVINSNAPGDDLSWANARADAGIGGYCHVMKWGKYSDIKPLTIRLDVPLWLNSPPANEDFFALRWIVGVSKTF